MRFGLSDTACLRQKRSGVNNNEHGTRFPLAVEVTSCSDATLIATIRGDVDLATASRLRTRLIDAVDSHNTRHVVINAAAMPFLDAAGIAAFVAVYRHAATRQVDVRLINVRSLVGTVLRIVELVDFFHATTQDPEA